MDFNWNDLFYMDFNFWKKLPSQTCLTLLFNKTLSVDCKYFHCTEDEVYCSYRFENNKDYNNCVSFLVYKKNKVMLNMNVDDYEFYEHNVSSKIKSIELKTFCATNLKPLNFSYIDKKYVDILNDNYLQFHLAHDYMDQGWTEIEESEVKNYKKPLFATDDEHVYLFEGEGLWINNDSLSKLEKMYNLSNSSN
jgi:hypothetical protein